MSEGEDRNAGKEGEDVRADMTPDERAQVCANEVNKVLLKWKCILNPYAIISGAGTTVHVKVIALMETPKDLNPFPFVNPNPENENDPSKFN